MKMNKTLSAFISSRVVPFMISFTNFLRQSGCHERQVLVSFRVDRYSSYPLISDYSAQTSSMHIIHLCIVHFQTRTLCRWIHTILKMTFQDFLFNGDRIWREKMGTLSLSLSLKVPTQRHIPYGRKG